VETQVKSMRRFVFVDHEKWRFIAREGGQAKGLVRQLSHMRALQVEFLQRNKRHKNNRGAKASQESVRVACAYMQSVLSGVALSLLLVSRKRSHAVERRD
jgi:predicted amidophosphoribosyltransferase